MQLIESENTRFIKVKESTHAIKQGIWAYFFLLIFEGALRKWFVPGLATPLLIIRDPVAAWVIYDAWRRGFIPSSIYLKGFIAIGLIGIYTAIFLGHGNLWVALYGARVFLIQLPFMFIVGQVFNREDIIKMGKITLYISLVMVVLIYLQFKSPQSAWVNRGVGGDLAGAGFSGSGDYFRPPGTFSFTLGTTLFFGFIAPFVFYFWLSSEKINKWLLIGATIAMIVSIPVSISRSLFFEICLSLGFTLVVALRKPEYLSKIIISLIAGTFILVVLAQSGIFSAAIDAFTVRFSTANEQEGGLVKGVLIDRFLGGLVAALTDSSHRSFFGAGLGMGTNVGSQLLTGKATFLIAEGAWAQLIGELGSLMGLIVIFLRVGLALQIAIASYGKMVKGDFLPWLLLSFGFIVVMQSVWSQPTSLGFCIIIGGLLLASLKGTKKSAPAINNQLTE